MTLATGAVRAATGESPDRTLRPRRPWWRRPEPLLALAGSAAMSVVVLAHATALIEPDDYACRASIVALAKGQVLSNAQYRALVHRLARFDPADIAQWHHLASGKWISEENPGYALLVALFHLAGAPRRAPLLGRARRARHLPRCATGPGGGGRGAGAPPFGG
jgi:hypothetical protein